MTTQRDKTYFNRGHYQGYELAKTYAKSLGNIPNDSKVDNVLYVSTDGTELTHRQKVVNQGFKYGYEKAMSEFERNNNVVPDSWIKREIES
jgi:hypothetical protein